MSLHMSKCHIVRNHMSRLKCKGKYTTLLSVLIVTLSCGKTLSTSIFQSEASVVDSMISSGLDFSWFA